MNNIQLWNVFEAEFSAKIIVDNIDQAQVDVVFSHKDSDTVLTVPAFWDGEYSWLVRFAPTKLGAWSYTVKQTDGVELGIDGITGELNAVEYTGEYAIYKHGFVKTEKGKKYFVYDDGTPFFYLGDTHWNMVTEEYDSAGPNAGNIQTDSHFKYIVDRRADQGFTVYQSEPIGHKYDLKNGKIEASDIEDFRTFDKYFKYIAEKGLVHANAELIFPSEMNEAIAENLYNLTRYWIARYGAYPVMWSLGQEVDYLSAKVKEHLTFAYPKMCEIIAEIDPYNHPLSAHQMNAASITTKGGVAVGAIDGGYNEYNPFNTQRTGKNRTSDFLNTKGHNWWASQWRPIYDQQYNFGIPKDYWENGDDKPIVDYEARYHFLYGGDFGMRAQAWIALLAGMIGGVAYGGADMWLYKGRYAVDTDGNDGVEAITSEKKQVTYWCDLIDAPISSELIYMRRFFEDFDWWKLEPDFDYGNAFKAVEGKEGFYSAAYIGNEKYVVYLYNRSADSRGKLVNMDKNATYTARWFNTLTGKYSVIDEELKPDENGEYDIPRKPLASDMVLIVTKN